MTVLNICNKIIEYSFYLLFFFVPLVIASDTSELFEFNKMWLTFGFSLVIAASWITKMIRQSRIFIQRTPLDIPIALFLLSQVISTIFSWDTHVSFWGYYSRFNGGLLSILTYVFLYYAFVSNFLKRGVARLEGVPSSARRDPPLAETEDIGWDEGATGPRAITVVKRLLFISLISGAVVALWGLPSHFGYDPTCFLFRHTLDVSCWTEDFQPKIRIFSTLGQPDWLAAYLAILLPISIAFAIKNSKSQAPNPKQYPMSKNQNTKQKGFGYLNLKNWNLFGIWNLGFWIFLLLSALFYLDLLYTRARSGIIAVWLSLAFFVVLYILLAKREFLKLSILLIVFLSISFFIGTPFSQINKLTFSEIKAQFTKSKIENTSKTPRNARQLGGTDSGKIRGIVWKGAINTWLHHPLFGTGVETFAFAYYRYKEAAQNLTSEWNFLYNKAHNEYLNYLATTGAFGLGSYLLIIGTFVFQFFRYLNHKSQITNHKQIQNTKDSNTKHIGNWNLFGIWNLEFGILNIALLASYLSILITNFFGFSVVITNIYLFMIPSFVFILGGMINPQKQFVFPSKKTVNPSLLERQSITIYQWTFIVILLFTICYLIFNLLKFWNADKSYSLGYNLNRAGEHLSANPYLRKAVQLRSEPVFKDELAVSDVMLAVELLGQKNSDKNKEDLIKANSLAQEAIGINDQLTLNHEHNVVFWKTRTRIFYNLSQIDSQHLPLSLNAIQKAASLSPNDASISYNLGVLYGQNDDIKKAITVLENTIKLKPNYQDAHYALGLFYHEVALDEKGVVVNQSYQQKAIKQMRYIIDNFPSSSSAKEAIDSWEKK